MDDIKTGGLRLYFFRNDMVNHHVDYIRNHDIINDYISIDSVEEVTILIEEIFAHVICDDSFDGYYNAKDKNNYINVSVIKAFNKLGDHRYKDLMLTCNLNRSIDDHPPVILSMNTFKREANISNIIEVAKGIFENKLYRYRQQLYMDNRAEGGSVFGIIELHKTAVKNT